MMGVDEMTIANVDPVVGTSHPSIDGPLEALPKGVSSSGTTLMPEEDASTPSEEVAPTASDPVASPWGEAVESLKNHISLEMRKIDAVLNDKLAYDRFKEEQITRLHDELKAYKSDLIFETMKPLVNGLIRIHDDMAKVTESVVAEGAEAATKSVSLITGFQEDIEILLTEVDVISYREEMSEFDPRRQQSIRTMPTAEKSQVGHVAQHLRLGFERGERIVRKEKVSVFVLDPNSVTETPKSELQEIL